MYFFQQAFFVIRNRYLARLCSLFRKMWYCPFGLKVGAGTQLTSMTVTWPHQVAIGKNCSLEKGIYFKYDGIWQPGPSIIIGDSVFIGSFTEFNIKKKLAIGNDSLIASGCRFIDHDHGLELTSKMRTQDGPAGEIIIGSDVWIGCNVVVLKGVTIEDGAVVAAGAVVTKSIPKNEIWGGIPAKKIGERK